MKLKKAIEVLKEIKENDESSLTMCYSDVELIEYLEKRVKAIDTILKHLE